MTWAWPLLARQRAVRCACRRLHACAQVMYGKCKRWRGVWALVVWWRLSLYVHPHGGLFK